ncbi:glycosyltransferase [Planctobacterium marinum]|uniref:LPS biosynthesis protein RfbU n=1 Tax=Planctobacterium marinum TaxID=1631968 RepID=A0AA48KTK8_9ALTE|nr:LPS biosynthesis protein RfbU [Planctobacterium marinum]
MAKQFLILSNMYPTTKTPTQGVFVKNIEMALQSSGMDVERVVLAGRHDSYVLKAFFYLKYIIQAFIRLLFTRRIVYLHYVAHSSIPVLIASLFRNLSIVAHVHGGDVLPAEYEPEWVRNIKLSISRRALKKAGKIIVPSKYFCQLLIEKFDIPSEIIEVNPSGGVDTKKFKPRESKQPSFAAENRLILGYVGRLDSGKGIETLIAALKKLDVDFCCHFVGTGVRGEDFKKLTKTLELADKVIFHGAVPQAQLPEFYTKFDYLVFPSEMQESLGLVGLEAMACGVPVIGTMNAGMADYLVDQQNGIGFSSGSVDSLVNRIMYSCSLTAEEYLELCHCARKTALQYDAQTSNTHLMEILH